MHDVDKVIAEIDRAQDEIVQQISRTNHFTVVESWRSREAFDQHSMAAHVREFRDKLKPMSGALYDERLYEPLI